MQKIAILTNSVYVPESHKKYYDFLYKNYKVVYISTFFFEGRKNSWKSSLLSIDILGNVSIIFLTLCNVKKFLREINMFEVIIFNGSNYSLINLLIFKYANIKKVKIIDVHLASDNFLRYKVKVRFLLLRKVHYMARNFLILKSFFLCFYLDKRLLFYYICNFSPLGSKFLYRKIPTAYRASKVFLMFNDEIEFQVHNFGYCKYECEVIGPYDRIFPSKNLSGEYVLFIDSNFIGNDISFHEFEKIVHKVKSKKFLFVYAPHPAMNRYMCKSIIAKIKRISDVFLDIGETNNYINKANSIITFATSTSYISILKRKNTYFIHNKNYKKKREVFFKIQETLSKKFHIPNIDIEEYGSILTPYPEVDYDGLFKYLYGSPDIDSIIPKKLILEHIKGHNNTLTN
jgi:hypothetical protein